MISREELHKRNYSKLGKSSLFNSKYIYWMIDEIYYSIGTCEQCNHYRDGLCFLRATHNYEAPLKDSDDYCKSFERKEDEEN